MDDVVEFFAGRSSWGVILANTGFDHGLVAGVLVALLVAAIVGVVFHVIEATRGYAGPAALLTFVVLLLLLLL